MIVVFGSTVVVVAVVVDVVIDVHLPLLSSSLFATEHNIVFERKDHRKCAIEKTHMASQHNSHIP